MNDPKLQDSLRETLSDIDYFQALVVAETSDLRKQMQDVRSGSPGLEAQIDKLIERISATLGGVSARVRVIEQVLAAEGRADPAPGALGEPLSIQPETYSLSAEDMGDTANLLALERTQNGVSFRWTSANPSTTFLLPISRVRRLGLTIDIVAVVKPEYLQQMQVMVDGEPSAYELWYEDGINRARLNLPARSNGEVTQLEVRVPATHSPQEFGDSTDSRKIGIAISKLTVGEPVKLSGGRKIRSKLRRLVARA